MLFAISSSSVSLTPAPFFVPSLSMPPRHRPHPPATAPAPTASLPLRMMPDYGYGGGLTDDGDFAILGINVAPDEDEDGRGGEGEEKKKGDEYDDFDDSANSNTGDDDDYRRRRRMDYDTGTSIGWQGVGNMLFDESLLRSGRVDLGAGPTRRYRDFRGNNIVPKSIDADVRDWLSGLLPTLDAYDLEAYAEGLTNIGFAPSCPSQCEVRYDDLDFMKVLHRRYLFKEITGEGHPFEP